MDKTDNQMGQPLKESSATHEASRQAQGGTHHSKKPRKSQHKRRSPKPRLVRELLVAIAAHSMVLGLAALASGAWLYFAKDPAISWWVLVFALVLIVFAYFTLISFQYFFPGNFLLRRRPRLHFSLLALVIVIVTAPLAMLQSLTRARTNELLAQKSKLESDLNNLRQTQDATDNKRIRLSSHVTDSVTRMLQKPKLDSADLFDLLNICIESISLSKPQIHDLRGAIVYLDKTGKYLIVPDQGYAGYGLNQDIKSLYFNVSPQQRDESDEEYRNRLGIAGWSYVKRKPILDGDVQTPKPGLDYRYKPPPTLDKADRAMICIGIPDLKEPKAGRYVGILSISSLTQDVFTENDLAIARFFATLLGRFKVPIETPQSVWKAEQSRK